MFDTIYLWVQEFFFDLENTTLSLGTIDLATTLITCFFIGFCIWVASLPFKWLFSLIGR